MYNSIKPGQVWLDTNGNGRPVIRWHDEWRMEDFMKQRGMKA